MNDMKRAMIGSVFKFLRKFVSSSVMRNNFNYENYINISHFIEKKLTWKEQQCL